METAMRKRFLVVGVGAMLALTAVGATDASACSRGYRNCDYYAPPTGYRYAPQAYSYGYGYGGYGPPPAAVYGWAEAGYGYAPPAYVYGRAPAFYGNYYGRSSYGYRGYRRCDRDYYGYAPPAYYGYRRSGLW
jgi:hypothetical protein